jgi:hypothetical protein
MTIDDLFRRLAARGRFEIVPTDVAVEVDHDPECGPTCHAQHFEPRFAIGIGWAPRGQWGNPLCSLFVTRSTLEQALTAMVDLTIPPRASIEYLAWERQRLQQDMR